MSRIGALLLLLWIVPWISGAAAVQPGEQLADPALEERARGISAGLRCLVCQNQSIDDSNAPLARDLRLLVRERLSAGDSDSQVIDFLVSRYGEFVLLKPRFEWHTAALWLLPPVILLAGAIAVFLSTRRRPVASDPALSEAERVKLSEILRHDNARDQR